jgi:hypothetical protein
MITRLRTRTKTRISHRFLQYFIQSLYAFWCNSAANNATNRMNYLQICPIYPSALFANLLICQFAPDAYHNWISGVFQLFWNRAKTTPKLHRKHPETQVKHPWNTPRTATKCLEQCNSLP